jgi:hypothetical protein
MRARIFLTYLYFLENKIKKYLDKKIHRTADLY